jgi:hypothetical protein
MFQYTRHNGHIHRRIAAKTVWLPGDKVKESHPYFQQTQPHGCRCDSTIHNQFICFPSIKSISYKHPFPSVVFDYCIPDSRHRNRHINVDAVPVSSIDKPTEEDERNFHFSPEILSRVLIRLLKLLRRMRNFSSDRLPAPLTLVVGPRLS